MKPNPMIQYPFLGGFLGAKVDGISLMQVHPLDPCTLINLQPSDGPIEPRATTRIPSSAMRQSSRRVSQRPAFTAEETRHHFAIEALDKSGPFRPQPYLYTCVRCKWIFRINDARGSVIALDGLGRHLPEPENAKRMVTFHRGPCPAFPLFEYLVTEDSRETSFGDYMSRFVAAVRHLTHLGRRQRRASTEQTLS
jgi:hypothetical protein